MSKLIGVKRQLKNMMDALNDIESGNGNRKILAANNELTADLSYKMNEIVYRYEGQLSQLKVADETNRQIMTSLSHDVRTPLTTLIGYLDEVHRGVIVGKEREDYLEIARRKAHDLKDYIDILFDWFKLNSSEFALSIERVEIAELTRNMLKDWIPIFEENHLDYEIEIPEKSLLAKVDMDGYARIVNNLVQNVITHSQAGLFTGLLQMLGISAFTYIAVLPILVFTSRKPGIFMGGVIVSFLFGYSAMFIKNVTMRSLYPILSGLTVMRFDTETFMNTSEPGNLTLSMLSLAVMLLLTIVIVILTNPPQAASKRKKHKTAGMFIRQGQKGQ